MVKPFRDKRRHGPEYYIQKDLVEFLKTRGWMVERMIGNAFQMGIPDLYVAHPRYGDRWIDVKVEGRNSLTKAQRLKWPNWEGHRVGIWILTEADQANYDKLFMEPNWRDYWKASYGEIPDVDSLLDEMHD